MQKKKILPDTNDTKIQSITHCIQPRYMIRRNIKTFNSYTVYKMKSTKYAHEYHCYVTCFYILNTLDPQLQDIKRDNRFLKFREENLEV